MATRNGVTVRGTSNSNQRGNNETRRKRREWLVETYRANVDVDVLIDGLGLIEVPLGTGTPCCRCYRCGTLLTVNTVTVDRIVPGCKKTKMFPNGGTYVRWNIRPACLKCNSETGGGTRSGTR